eukprot:3351885-Rhodomonas_salina.2
MLLRKASPALSRQTPPSAYTRGVRQPVLMACICCQGRLLPPLFSVHWGHGAPAHPHAPAAPVRCQVSRDDSSCARVLWDRI